jgi:hypothetical protein
MIYWSIEPPWWDRLERSIALLTTLFANAHRDTRAGKSYSLEDFLPDYWEEPIVEETEDGMAPQHVMHVMEGFMRAQEERMKGEVIKRPFRGGRR